MDLEFRCDSIEVTDTGMGVHIEFNELNGKKERYFIIQKHFEDDESYDGISYVELGLFDEAEIQGHHKVKVELARSECMFIFGDSKLTFKLNVAEDKFDRLKRFLNILASVKMVD